MMNAIGIAKMTAIRNASRRSSGVDDAFPNSLPGLMVSTC
jgi:hypothetical protein